MENREKKSMHINLIGDDQLDDYDVVCWATGITNDNDIVRYLFRTKANEIRAQLSRTDDGRDDLQEQGG